MSASPSTRKHPAPSHPAELRLDALKLRASAKPDGSPVPARHRVCVGKVDLDGPSPSEPEQRVPLERAGELVIHAATVRFGTDIHSEAIEERSAVIAPHEPRRGRYPLWALPGRLSASREAQRNEHSAREPTSNARPAREHRATRPDKDNVRRRGGSPFRPKTSKAADRADPGVRPPLWKSRKRPCTLRRR